MVERILRLRGTGDPESRAGRFQIGCIMLSAPVFFPPESCVSPPGDWAKTGIQQGKSYDLRSGEGARVLADCLARARETARPWNVEELSVDPLDRHDPIEERVLPVRFVPMTGRVRE